MCWSLVNVKRHTSIISILISYRIQQKHLGREYSCSFPSHHDYIEKSNIHLLGRKPEIWNLSHSNESYKTLQFSRRCPSKCEMCQSHLFTLISCWIHKYISCQSLSLKGLKEIIWTVLIKGSVKGLKYGQCCTFRQDMNICRKWICKAKLHMKK